MGEQGQDRAPMRLFANPNIQCLKAVPEETPWGAFKSPVLFQSAFLAVNISLSPSVIDGTRPLRPGNCTEENKGWGGGGGTRALDLLCPAN